jgi:hypothetical protein
VRHRVEKLGEIESWMVRELGKAPNRSCQLG